VIKTDNIREMFIEAQTRWFEEQIIRKVESILIMEGQHDRRFKLGEIIKYSPSKVAELLRKHYGELLQAAIGEVRRGGC